MIVILLGLVSAGLAVAALATGSIPLAVATATVAGAGLLAWGVDLAAARVQTQASALGPDAGTGTGVDETDDAAATQNAATTALRDAVVYVIPGRDRFHRSGCSSVASRDSEELSLEEARANGLLPCGRCSTKTSPTSVS
jgi:hypothetical protein